MAFDLYAPELNEYIIHLNKTNEDLVVKYDEYTILGENKTAIRDLQLVMNGWKKFETNVDEETTQLEVMDEVIKIEKEILRIYNNVFGEEVVNKLMEYNDNNLYRMFNGTQELIADFISTVSAYSQSKHESLESKYKK